MGRLCSSRIPRLWLTPGLMSTYPPSPLGTLTLAPSTSSASGGVRTVQGASEPLGLRREKMSTGGVRDEGLEAGSRIAWRDWSEDSDWTRVTVEVDFKGVEVTYTEHHIRL